MNVSMEFYTSEQEYKDGTPTRRIYGPVRTTRRFNDELLRFRRAYPRYPTIVKWHGERAGHWTPLDPDGHAVRLKREADDPENGGDNACA